MFAELHCLNCGRHLADLVRTTGGGLALRHPGGEESRPILVDLRPTGPRCARCGGKAMLERPLSGEISPKQPVRRQPLRAA